MRREEATLDWINRLLAIPSRIGILPTLQFLKIPELEAAISQTGFIIAETETIPFSPADGQTYLVGRFVAAIKT